MNISLSGAGKKKKASLGFGLNNRSDKKKSSTGSKNVFGDESDDDEEGDDKQETSGRQAVNQQIAKEQAALRKRAQEALATAEDPSMYDYDGAYDSFKPEPEKKEAASANKERKSKYIGDLLKAAKVRERERDAIHERKIAREQAEEDAQDEFAGKEKFVTKAYKRKLEERKQWEMEQEEKQREEDENDVTKKTGGAAMAGFYGNFNKNVAVGGQKNEEVEKEEEPDPPKERGMESLDDFDPRQGFMSGFEHSKAEGDEEEVVGKQAEEDLSPLSDSMKEPPTPKLTMREIRGKKVAEARIRYLKRKEAAAMSQ